MDQIDPAQTQSTQPQTKVVKTPLVTTTVAEPESISDGVFRHLDPAYLTTERIGWWIFEGVVDIGIIGCLLAMWLTGWLTLPARIGVSIGLIVIAGLIRWGGTWHPRRTHNSIRYSLSQNGMEIHRGIWWKRVIYVPKSRIQHTDVSQGPLARKFKLGKLTMHTAGTANASIELDGLPHDRALLIRNFLIDGDDADGV